MCIRDRGTARSIRQFSSMRLPTPPESSLRNAFTISCWILPDGPPFRHTKVFDLGTPGPPYGTILLEIDSATGRPAFQIAFSDGTWKRMVAQRDRTGWIHLATSWDDSRRLARFYVDGELQGEFTSEQSLYPFEGHELILGNQESGDDGLQGALDEFRIEWKTRTGAWIRHQWFTQKTDASTIAPMAQ